MIWQLFCYKVDLCNTRLIKSLLCSGPNKFAGLTSNFRLFSCFWDLQTSILTAQLDGNSGKTYWAMFLIFFSNFLFVLVCVCVGEGTHMHVGSEDNFQLIFFHYVRSGNQTQVVRFGGICLYQLTHLAGSLFYFLNSFLF